MDIDEWKLLMRVRVLMDENLPKAKQLVTNMINENQRKVLKTEEGESNGR